MRSTKPERKTIFIDRDGVINEDPIGDYVKRWEDFRFIPGVIQALKQLTDHDFEIVIISNQAGIGDGIYSKAALEEITEGMKKELNRNGVRLRGIYYCLHGKEENCDCRKPKTGLFRQATKDIDFNPSETFFIGDKVSDIQAGRDFGLRTLFVLTGHGTQDQFRLKEGERPEEIFSSLKEAVDYVIGHTKND